MKDIFRRCVAFALDIIFVMVVVSLISNIGFINPQLKNYNKYYKVYQDEYSNYQDFIVDISNYYKDNKITDKEYNKLVSKYSDYEDDIVKYYSDNKISKKEYDKILSNVNKRFQNKYKKLYYYISKNSVVYDVIYIVVLLLYFVGFSMITNGETLGKKVMKLRVVSNKDSKVTFLNYLIRALILYNPIYYLMILIGPYMFNINSFYSWASIWGSIKNYLYIILFVSAIFRADRRGLHDILSNTKVIYVKDDLKKKDEDLEVIKDNNKPKRKGKSNKKIIIDGEVK